MLVKNPKFERGSKLEPWWKITPYQVEKQLFPPLPRAQRTTGSASIRIYYSPVCWEVTIPSGPLQICGVSTLLIFPLCRSFQPNGICHTLKQSLWIPQVQRMKLLLIPWEMQRTGSVLEILKGPVDSLEDAKDKPGGGGMSHHNNPQAPEQTPVNYNPKN